MFEAHELPCAAFEDDDGDFGGIETDSKLRVLSGLPLVVDDILLLRLDSSKFTLFSLN